MTLNVNLGAPYEAKINKIIKKGYAASQTEVIRQAIMFYDKYLEQEEEVQLVYRAVEAEMAEVESGKQKTYTAEQIKKEFGLK
ncbi:hypothetical protein [Methanocella sp. MCL-LM]|uniref:hypothetical protein n=1 Tax=Methanocella sp. MCL-LM TaxID=3412035 RepID=UPI003C746BF7